MTRKRAVMTSERGRGSPARPLRLAIVGFGALAQRYYVPALRGLAGAEVVAVADPLPAAQAAAARLLSGVVIFPTHSELLGRARVDAALVASVPSTHLELWRALAAAGLPTFAEKPLLLAGQAARAPIDAAARRTLMVNFNRRFWPAYRRLGRLVQEGAVGALRHAAFTLEIDVLAWSSMTRHRLMPGEGGVLYDLGSHILDLAPMIVGRAPSTIRARIDSERWPGDRARLELGFDGGFVVECALGYAARNVERVRIQGSAGRLRLDDPNMAVHVEHGGAALGRPLDRCADVAVLGYRALRRQRSMLRHTIRAALAEFLDRVRTGGPFAPGFDDAARNAAWLEAAQRAAATNRSVRLQTESETVIDRPV